MLPGIHRIVCKDQRILFKLVILHYFDNEIQEVAVKVWWCSTHRRYCDWLHGHSLGKHAGCVHHAHTDSQGQPWFIDEQQSLGLTNGRPVRELFTNYLELDRLSDVLLLLQGANFLTGHILQSECVDEYVPLLLVYAPCFADVFCFFSVRKKIWDNRFRERLNGFSWNFYQTIPGKMEFATSCRRLANGECWWFA